MPRGYQLNTYYDALRAIFRKIYSNQIRFLSGTIDRCGLKHSDGYSLILYSLNKGLYDNLSTSLYSKTHRTTSPAELVGKSAYSQDFMSPLELRMNAIAVRRAERAINQTKYRGGFTLKNLQDICYAEGQAVAVEFNHLAEGDNAFNMKIPAPVLSVKPIIKKFDQLSRATLPKDTVLVQDSAEKRMEKENYVLKNNYLFRTVNSRLIELGLLSKELRHSALCKFNTAYYEMDIKDPSMMEVTKILIRNKEEDFVTTDELKMNCAKLEFLLNSLKTLGAGTPVAETLRRMSSFGEKARQVCVAKNRALPELYSGFYYTYTDAYKSNEQESEEQNVISK